MEQNNRICSKTVCYRHALINKPEAVKDYFKVKFHKSDHDLICVEMKINVQYIEKAPLQEIIAKLETTHNFY